MYAKKSLGQHFLKSEKALRTIIESAEIKNGETVLEIGPGQGVLTERLLAYSLQLVAVEKDDTLYKMLQTKFKEEISTGKLTLVHGDILEFDPANYNLQAHNYKLVANIPYNITGAILEKFLSHQHQPESMVLLVQKEVAQRIVARDDKESILSISVKAYGTPRYVETVLAGSFAPAPKVDSAIIRIDGVSKAFFQNPASPAGGFSEKAFFTLLQAGFQSKRKKLSSNLAKVSSKEAVQSAFSKLSLDENVRAEDVSVENWSKLATFLCYN